MKRCSAIAKKGAVTEFIIIGMIIVIVFLFLLYLGTTLRQEAQDNPQQRLLESKLRTKTFELYVQSCLQTALDESLQELGNAGGYVLVSSPRPQGGRSFLLQKNAAILPVPDYPCTQIPCRLSYDPVQDCTVLSNLNNCHFSLDPTISESLLLPLTGRESITTQLITLAEQKLSTCADLGQTAAANAPFSITSGTPALSLKHETQSISLTLLFPFILNTDAGEESQVASYQLTIPIRLRLFHAFLEELLYRDSSDLGFRIDQDFTALTSYFVGFNVSVDRTSAAPDDMITAIDTVSEKGISSLSFTFLRENLPPSLNYISYAPEQNYDVVLQKGTGLVPIPLTAYDPNEDTITYSAENNPFASLDSSNQSSSLFIDTTNSGSASFTVSASDGYLQDYQVLRLIIR